MRRIICFCIVLVVATPAAAGEDVVILAKDLSARSTNIIPVDGQFGDLVVCHGRNGFEEWTANVKGGQYYIHFFYCSGERRPCTMSVNGEALPGQFLGDVTGGFMPEHLRWETCGPVTLKKGHNRIRISVGNSYMPHLKGLVVSTGKKLPKRSVFPISPRVVKARLAKFKVEPLRQAVKHLLAAYPAEYACGETFLAQIDAFKKRLAPISDGEPPAPQISQQLIEDIEKLRYDALVKHNPLMNFDKLLFVKRRTLQSSHYYTDFIDGCRHFGGNLCLLSLADGKVTELVPSLKDGIIGRIDLSFDAKRAVFDYKPSIGKGFRIYEVGVDGKGLRQLTFDPPDEQARIKKYRQGWHRFYMHHTDDMHPCYLPDGGICFASSRCEFGVLCDAPDILSSTTLFRMDGDGKNMQMLSNGALSESAPSVMNDGRILYTRWEYVDKGAVSCKPLWAMRPDGSASVEIFGNDITFPDTMNQGRAIPGYNNLFVFIGAPHMPLGVGALIRIDINYPIRTRQPMTYISPDIDVRQEWGFNNPRNGRWAHTDKGPLFQEPYPLSDKFFLVSYNPDRKWNDPTAYGLYMVDEFGNRVLIHREAASSCWGAYPLRPRPRPPVLPSQRPSDAGPKQRGTIVLSDVYVGLYGVKRGAIKYLRVLEQVPRPWKARRFWDGDTYDQQHAVVSKNAHLGLKVLHGIVPVEEDGSAHFTVPADKNIFFQALDENFMAVQTMRTFVDLRPGEKRSCIGCHELRSIAPASKFNTALEKPPVTPGPQPGEVAPRPIYYPTDVQPILDKHCVRCHSGAEPRAKLDLTGTMTTLFSRSYENLLDRRLLKVIGENHPKTGNVQKMHAYTLNSPVSKLIKQVQRGCTGNDVKLTQAEFVRLVTWVDSNAQYYGSYYGRRNIKYKGHPDFRPVPTFESASGIPPKPSGDSVSDAR